jgi:hypothetical protein
MKNEEFEVRDHLNSTKKAQPYIYAWALFQLPTSSHHLHMVLLVLLVESLDFGLVDFKHTLFLALQKYYF